MQGPREWVCPKCNTGIVAIANAVYCNKRDRHPANTQHPVVCKEVVRA